MEQVVELAGLAGAALADEPVEVPPGIDMALAGVHQIAPLLNIALRTARPDLTGCEPVLHAGPARLANRPGLYGRDGCRIDGGADLSLGYRERPSAQGHVA
ncbi:MAG: hypothetical protein ABI240_11965 [Sphingomonas sp.]